jgi:SAM-dependent methyltransferase
MNWGEQFKWRGKVHEQYPEVWDLRIVRKRLPFILKYLKDGEAVLEVGAFDRSLEQRLKRDRPAVSYKSLDIDPTYPHDYRSLDQVQERFDLVLLFELIEHLDWRAGREMAGKIYGILNPGGRVIVTTPNVYTPGQYWKDASHLTPYHYEELGGLFMGQGFEVVEICRLFNDAVLPYAAKAYVFASFFRFLGIDFARSILLAARKP